MSVNRRNFVTAGVLAPSTLLINSAYAAVTNEPTDVDIGYCQDMTVHHLQALAMCQRVLGRDTGSAVQAAAAEVLQNQAMEVGQMRAWLADWLASTVPPTVVMGWMGANQGQGMPIANMPGYASDEALTELSTATGINRGRKWLELMRDHHEGGVTMAAQAEVLASSEKVIRLAKGQVASQSYEIYQYELLLAGQYS